jgi:hypothetical protein
MCRAMEVSPAKLVKEYGLSVVHRASGIPIGTLARWAQKDEVPGTEGTKRMREAQLASALAKLKADGTPKKQRRAA